MMNKTKDWQNKNNDYLSKAMNWLQCKLEFEAQIKGKTKTEVKEAEDKMKAAEESQPSPALIILRKRFNLSPFETKLLLLCIAMEWDRDIPHLYAKIQGDQRNYPTFYLGLTVFEKPSWDVVSPERPLRKWQFIEILQSGVEPLITSPLRADERIVNYIKGLNYLDDRLAKLIFPWSAFQNNDTQHENFLPPSQEKAVRAITTKFQQNSKDRPGNTDRYFAAIELLGPDTSSKLLVARHVCAELNLELYPLSIGQLPTDSHVLEIVARLWERESFLYGIALYVDLQSQEDYLNQGQKGALYRFLESSEGFFLIDIRDKTLALKRQTFTLEIAKPTVTEQKQAWERVLGKNHSNIVLRLVGQFNLSITVINRILKEANIAPKEPVEKEKPEQDKESCEKRDPRFITKINQQKLDKFSLMTWCNSPPEMPEETGEYYLSFDSSILSSEYDPSRDSSILLSEYDPSRDSSSLSSEYDPSRDSSSLSSEYDPSRDSSSLSSEYDPSHDSSSLSSLEKNYLLEQLLWNSCLENTRPQLENLAQRIEVKADWENIVLPKEETDLLHKIADQVRQRGRVYEEWGFHRRMNRGKGISALFSGESGTGKTMAAEVIANELNLHLYRIDLGTVVSKYIGETEKNLGRLFDAAEDGGAILFFDEADALFGKRSEVKDAHDRYANIEIDYLLQRLEAYRGLAILATNQKSSIDRAFLRRLRFVVNFPLPGVAEREKIWQKVFPSDTPKDQLDWNRLSKFNLTGGNIHSIALNTAFMAAADGEKTRVTMEIVLKATRMEFKKLEKLVNEADFQ